MKISASQVKHIIQWIAWMQLDDLDFTDDHCNTSLCSSKPQHTQGKSKILKYNTVNTNSIIIDAEALEEVKNSCIWQHHG
ncbi:unnamed protein product [Schistosoma margrebowiei]|uniref:Uncharacterized protein n=1 Tax=Schistosoma margrebowiei TaxID=48269 RepID=A0A183N7L8_9TREM|nr:unnamed protein product [Schistosoma margrebowiei]